MKKYLFIILALYPGLLFACSMVCGSLSEVYAKADYVFLGYTVKVDETGSNRLDDKGHEPEIIVHFDIKKNWKGDWGNRPLKTLQNKWSCYGGGFQEHNNYIMFLNKDTPLTLCGQKQYSEDLVNKLDNISNMTK